MLKSALSSIMGKFLHLYSAFRCANYIYITPNDLPGFRAFQFLTFRLLSFRCINGFLKNKLRILCTHQTQFVQNADKILVLNKEGKVDGYGTYKELTAENNAFLADDNVFGKKQEEETVVEEAEKTEKVEEDTEESDELKRFRRQESKVEKEEEEDEDAFMGKITWRSYRDFFMAGTSYSMLAMVVVFCIIAQTLHNMSDWWLAYW